MNKSGQCTVCGQLEAEVWFAIVTWDEDRDVPPDYDYPTRACSPSCVKTLEEQQTDWRYSWAIL